MAHMVMNTALHLLTDFMSWSCQQRERSPQIPSSITCRAWGEKTKKQNNKQGAQQVKVSLPYLTTACFLLLPLLSSLAQHHTAPQESAQESPLPPRDPSRQTNAARPQPAGKAFPCHGLGARAAEISQVNKEGKEWGVLAALKERKSCHKDTGFAQSSRVCY